MVVALESLPSLNAEQLRELVQELIAKMTQQSQQHACVIAAKDSDILYRQAKIDKLIHELATLKRWKFGRSSELLNAGQVSLLDETIDADIAAIEQELKTLAPAAKTDTQARQQPTHHHQPRRHGVQHMSISAANRAWKDEAEKRREKQDYSESVLEKNLR